MINPNHDLSLTRQAELLQLSRASIYYEPVGISKADLKLMRRIDELHLEWPFLGSRMLRNMLRLEGIAIGRKHVATLMRKMGIEARQVTISVFCGQFGGFVICRWLRHR
jgi:putative transposase